MLVRAVKPLLAEAEAAFPDVHKPAKVAGSLTRWKAGSGPPAKPSEAWRWVDRVLYARVALLWTLLAVGTGRNAVTIDYAGADIFSDGSLNDDPYPYYEFCRAQGPVWREPVHGMFVVTGYDETVETYRDTDTFSSCNSFAGPFHDLPVVEGDDITEVIDTYRDRFPFHDNLITFDPPAHTAHRGLMMRLLTPKRLQENETFMFDLARRQIESFADRGTCEFVNDYAQPFSLLVIADLLGVPEEDRPGLREDTCQRAAGRHGPATPGQRIGISRRVLHPVHRGTPAPSSRLRAHPDGSRHVPRRIHPGGDRRRPGSGHPVRWWSGNLCSLPSRRGEAYGRNTGTSAAAP